jgi:hypothetical protein
LQCTRFDEMITAPHCTLEAPNSNFSLHTDHT